MMVAFAFNELSWPISVLCLYVMYVLCFLKGALSHLRQLFTAECPLEMMKNTFHFILKAFRSQDI